MYKQGYNVQHKILIEIKGTSAALTWNPGLELRRIRKTGCLFYSKIKRAHAESMAYICTPTEVSGHG